MKISTVILLLLMPMVVVAQNYQGMNGADIQKMMEQIQEVQACMENIDKKQFNALEKRQHQFNKEVQSLCIKGKRGEAQRKAVLFSNKMARNPIVKAVGRCGEIAKGVIPEMPFMNLDGDASNKHVCH